MSGEQFKLNINGNDILPPGMQKVSLENLMKWGINPKHAPAAENRIKQYGRTTDTKNRLRMKLAARRQANQSAQ